MSNTEISIPISDADIEKAAKQVFRERVKAYANELTCPVHGTLPETEFVDGRAKDVLLGASEVSKQSVCD